MALLYGGDIGNMKLVPKPGYVTGVPPSACWQACQGDSKHCMNEVCTQHGRAPQHASGRPPIARSARSDTRHCWRCCCNLQPVLRPGAACSDTAAGRCASKPLCWALGAHRPSAGPGSRGPCSGSSRWRPAARPRTTGCARVRAARVTVYDVAKSESTCRKHLWRMQTPFASPLRSRDIGSFPP